jgi:hypothetical protein
MCKSIRIRQIVLKTASYDCSFFSYCHSIFSYWVCGKAKCNNVLLLWDFIGVEPEDLNKSGHVCTDNFSGAFYDFISFSFSCHLSSQALMQRLRETTGDCLCMNYNFWGQARCMQKHVCLHVKCLLLICSFNKS